MAKGRGRVWMASMGWVSKKETEAANYDGYVSDGWVFLLNFIRYFPDFLLDLCRSKTADYGNEELIQRVIMRAKAMHQYVDITGCRGLT